MKDNVVSLKDYSSPIASSMVDESRPLNDRIKDEIIRAIEINLKPHNSHEVEDTIRVVRGLLDIL